MKCHELSNIQEPGEMVIQTQDLSLDRWHPPKKPDVAARASCYLTAQGVETGRSLELTGQITRPTSELQVQWETTSKTELEWSRRHSVLTSDTHIPRTCVLSCTQQHKYVYHICVYTREHSPTGTHIHIHTCMSTHMPTPTQIHPYIPHRCTHTDAHTRPKQRKQSTISCCKLLKGMWRSRGEETETLFSWAG